MLKLSQLLKLDTCKDSFAMDGLPLLTMYDDNLFIRNDYDILSLGQRKHLQTHLKNIGFTQVTGKIMRRESTEVEFPKPNHMLSQSGFKPHFIDTTSEKINIITPTMFAECLCYLKLQDGTLDLQQQLQALIDTCPFNIELLQILAINTDFEQTINRLAGSLTAYQTDVIERKFKRKRAY
ncbi:hypothetical protein E2K93_10015 [Thalassotalea sp. HSM 43]|uniref:hypothetical protein n=1 Tax=Thalassotalea sp. HSM 43 TaxID=2552945 RepID=UPI0010814973|nr:hypothetical protein [Thalassotalea sp. HSM 43]QBY04706.1 hypothetical protein E2K93_10015 [Thalassotalea sp. HSM 43]